MSITLEKQEIIKWLDGLTDETIIHQLTALKVSIADDSELSLIEKESIDKGLASINNGNIKSHEEVMHLTKLKFPDLFS